MHSSSSWPETCYVRITASYLSLIAPGQAIQAAVVAAGVPERLNPQHSTPDASQAPTTQQQGQARAVGTQSSAQSTITFNTQSEQLQESAGGAARSTAGDTEPAAGPGISQSRMSNKVCVCAMQ